MLTIVDILILISSKNFLLNSAGQKENLNAGFYLFIFLTEQISFSAELSMKKVL